MLKIKFETILAYKKSALFIIIILLASFLRLNQLGNNPPSLDWDEASLGYNAYSILKTGRDEFGRFLPISIRSFEDYKPAVYTYLTVPAIAFFDLNEFAVRFPSAILGIATVFMSFFLARRLLSEKIAFLVSFFLAISPWHLQFSRVAFESNASLFFVFTGFYFFLRGLERGKWFVPSAVLLTLSFYTYHSPRLVVPFIILGWTWYFRKEVLRQWKMVILSIGLALLLLIPFFGEAFGSGRARLSSVTVLTPQGNLDDSIRRIEDDTSAGIKFSKLIHNRRLIYARSVLDGYLDHFNLDFLFLTGDAPDRHHARDMGMLYIWEAPFILLGIITLLKKKNGFPIFWWFLCAPLASSLTTGTPHAVRALLLLPTFQIFTAIGIIAIATSFKAIKLKYVGKVLYICFGVIFWVSVYYYLESYYIHTPIEAAKDWQYGYKQAVLEASKHESEVEKIIMTYVYDQPHIFVLFFNKVDPTWYQSQWRGEEVLRENRAFGKYEFRRINWEQDKNLKNVLLVGGAQNDGSEIPDGASGKLVDIFFPDGSIAFRIVKR